MEQEGVPPPPLSAAPSTISHSTISPRTVLGRYRLGRFLGQGSFAKVHEARSLADGSAVAIKIIDKTARAFHAATLEPLIAGEIEAMRRLKHHPNILRIHEVMATRTKVYLVMELAEGGELLKKISRQRNFLLKEPEARRYFHQLVSALRFCHRHGVAHRDLKPQNLLLDAAGDLKVSDFGLSALPERVKDDGMLHTACGTPAFTAPEVLSRGRRDGAAAGYDGAKADAWSCGVILHALLAGRLPFDDGNLAAMFKQIQSRAIEFPDRVGRTARRVIRGLLDPNPSTRMSIERVAETAWFKKSAPPEPAAASLFEAPAGKQVGRCGNAFEIIAMSSGLDLSGLFEPAAAEGDRFRRRRRRERRFAAAGVAAEAAIERVREAGERLGFKTERGKDGRRLGLGKGRVVLVVEVVEVSEGLVLGEVKVVDGGDGGAGGGGELEEAQWEELSAAVGEAGMTWINDTV